VKNAQEAQLGEVLTAAQTAAARNFVNDIYASLSIEPDHVRYGGIRESV
jgi:hypothetical protein